ncbi:UV-stimulated scaffold protein A-like isoform X3 [Ostrea edulis]|nr:UV-stimulated scaffold protein A-like isoform X3 [Ostrea edulis]XP_056004927.1 UV-stimulated scaffold protein A-like isoform X3 [Ostrea edulis]
MYVKEAYHMLVIQLQKEHSEIRLSAFQMIDELFNRSHMFRDLLLSDLQTFLELTVEVDFDQPLPPPKAAASTLKASALRAIQQWNDKFGEAYKKLSLGFNFLQKCKKVDFNGIRARSEAEQRRERERAERQQRIDRDRVNKVLKEIEEIEPDIRSCLTEVENCFSIVLPTPEDFFLGVECSETAEGPSKCSTKDQNQQISETGTQKCVNCENQDSGQNHPSTSIASCEQCKRNGNDSENESGDVSRSPLNKANVKCTITDESSKEIVTERSERSEVKTEIKPGNRENTLKDSTSFSRSGINSEDKEESEKENTESESEDSSDDDMEDVGGFVQEHGLRNHQYSIAIDLQQGPVQLEENEDNLPVLTTLKDHYRLISTKHQPRVARWLQVLSKHGGKQEDVKHVIDIKSQLQRIKNKFYDLKVVPREEHTKHDDDSDDEFEDVPEKEGFEADVPDHLTKELATVCKKSTSSTKPTATVSSAADKPSTSGAGTKRAFVKASWSIRNELLEHDEKDPTTMIANLKRIKDEAENESSTSMTTSESCTTKHTDGSTSRKEKLLSNAPVVSYGVDLEHWENPNDIKVPEIVKYDSLHRFWSPSDVENCKNDSNSIGDLTKRTIPFVGTFQPVKWKCRAPLSNGSLCERMDRVKCPFHGKIVARDEYGVPAGEPDTPSTSTQGQSEEGRDWEDPELQADIEAAIGVDLGSKTGKGKGKGKGKGRKKKEPKYPNLTDINIVKNTTRTRLEKRVLNKSAMKRVNEVMDNLAYKRIRDRFGNQFNYSLR